MPREAAFHPRRIYPAACLPLQVAVAADMIRIGMGIVDRLKLPPVRIKKLPYLPAGILIASAIYEADCIAVQPDQPHLGRALYVIAASRSLHQFEHKRIIASFLSTDISYIIHPYTEYYILDIYQMQQNQRNRISTMQMTSGLIPLIKRISSPIRATDNVLRGW